MATMFGSNDNFIASEPISLLAMDANNTHELPMATFNSQPLLPSHHHHQNSMLYPPSQPPNAYPPPGIEPLYQQQHQQYDSNYLHPQHNNDINTLFVSGLPDDIKPREIHNLFRRRHGFDFCQLKYTGRGNQVVAFATFFNHPAAVATLNTLNGSTFDPRTGASLHIELARSNSRPKRLREGTGAYYVIDKRSKSSRDARATSSNDGDDGTDEPSGDNPKSSNKGDIASAESVDKTTDQSIGGERQPCSTIFIANLGPNCTEEELKEALSKYPGFHIVKMRANRGMPVAFADFEDANQATEAMQGLQGSELPSSDRGGMHLEYARSKMRKS